ncbi:Imm7 family immunity protein [Streptomyces sp. NPDC001356]
MFEHHGWITVRETAADDHDEPRLRQIIDELRLRIARMDSPYLLVCGRASVWFLRAPPRSR